MIGSNKQVVRTTRLSKLVPVILDLISIMLFRAPGSIAPHHFQGIKMYLKMIFLSGGLFVLSTTVSLSQTRTVTGSGDWSDSGNWENGNIGGGEDTDDDVELDKEVSITIRSGEVYTIATLDASKEGTITIETGGKLIVTENVTIDKEFAFNILGEMEILGDLDIKKELNLNVPGNLSVGGNMTVDKEAAIDVDGAIDIVGDIILDKDSSITGTGTISTRSCTTNGSPDLCDSPQFQVDLPIELISFDAQVVGSAVQLNWITATEENNDFFTISRSKDGWHFEELLTMSGAGNSSAKISYMAEDKDPLYGQSFYRLTQTDYDGTSENFSIIGVEFSGHANQVLVYPNPVINDEFTVFCQLDEENQLVVQDIFGRTVKSMALKPGKNVISTDGIRSSSRVKFLKIFTESGNVILNQKLIVN